MRFLSRHEMLRVSGLGAGLALLPRVLRAAPDFLDAGTAVRRAVFAQLAAEGTRVFGCHLPFPGLGRLIARGDGFRWQAEDWDAGV